VSKQSLKLGDASTGDRAPRCQISRLSGYVGAIPIDLGGGRVGAIKGKGFPAKEGRGDLLATVRIALRAHPAYPAPTSDIARLPFAGSSGPFLRPMAVLR